MSSANTTCKCHVEQVDIRKAAKWQPQLAFSCPSPCRARSRSVWGTLQSSSHRAWVGMRLAELGLKKKACSILPYITLNVFLSSCLTFSACGTLYTTFRIKYWKAVKDEFLQRTVVHFRKEDVSTPQPTCHAALNSRSVPDQHTGSFH